MEIKKDLPFECCENCPEFILDTREQVIFSVSKPSLRILTVSCKNKLLCKRLKENIKSEVKSSATSATAL